MFLSQGLNADETVLSVALVKPDTKLPHIYLFDTRYGIATTSNILLFEHHLRDPRDPRRRTDFK